MKFWWPNGEKMKQDLLQGNFAAGNAHSVTLIPAAKEKPDAVGHVTPDADRAFAEALAELHEAARWDDLWRGAGA